MDTKLIDKTKPYRSQTPSTYELLKEYISLRSKMRFTKLGTLQNILRIIMLTFRLGFSWAWEFVHPITVCVCGILSNLIAIMKLFQEKKQVIHIKKFNNKKADHTHQLACNDENMSSHNCKDREGHNRKTYIQYG